MMQKLQTAVWFAQRPRMWVHAATLATHRLQPSRDTPADLEAGTAWAAERAVSVAEALAAVGLVGEVPKLPPGLLEEGNERARRSAVRMGGPGDLNLLYAAVAISGAKHVVETGVAYGWSSLAILAALDGRQDARLASVDMPYPKMNNEAFVGIVVPERLRTGWTIVREPDRNGLKKAIHLVGGRLDLCHYDSDKSWRGRQYGYALLWDALRPGGLFISDDIQDNMAFAEFVGRLGLKCVVTTFDDKYVGMVRKA